MAIYHMHMGIIGHSGGRSACAHSAYISASKIENERTGITHDYTKKNDVIQMPVMLCENAPTVFLDRAKLWNAVEAKEKTANAQYARKIDAALPVELQIREDGIEEAKRICRNFGEEFTSRGMIFDGSIHWEKGNPHIDAMVTMRPFKEDGSWGTKEKKTYALDADGNRIPIMIDGPNGLEQKTDSQGRKQWKRELVECTGWNKKEFLVEIRQKWEYVCNDYLEREGLDRIDCRSFEERGIDRIPTMHEGVEAREIESRGEISYVCEANRQIKEENRIRDLIDEIKAGIVSAEEFLENIVEKISEIRAEIRAEMDQYDDISDKLRAAFIKGGEIIGRFERERTGADPAADRDIAGDRGIERQADRGAAERERPADTGDGREGEEDIDAFIRNIETKIETRGDGAAGEVPERDGRRERELETVVGEDVVQAERDPVDVEELERDRIDISYERAFDF